MNMPTRHAGQPTAYYTGARANHTPDMDVIFTGRASNDGELYLYNLRLDNSIDSAFVNQLDFVADATELMNQENWRYPDDNAMIPDGP